MYEFEVEHGKSISTSNIEAEVLHAFEAEFDQYEAITLLPWEEHCTECAMPQCYQTCDLYESRSDGKCRRFIGGIIPVNKIKNLQGYVTSVSFKRWGQLMAYGNLNRFTINHAKNIERYIYLLDRIVSNIPDKRLSVMGRRALSSRIQRRLKQAIARNGYFSEKTSREPDALLLEIFNPNEKVVNLSLSISRNDQDHYDIGFQKLLELKTGYNRIRIGVNEITQRINLHEKFGISLNPNILHQEDEGLTLYFGLLTFVWETKSAHSLMNAEIKEQKPAIKVIAWDLDNTLWNGILIEDGKEKLTLKPGIVEVIKELDRRGIMNTVVSKNNPDETLKYLEHIGLLDYFVYPKIGWDQKGVYLKTLVREFNVAENTFAFIDDQPFERDQALSLNPEVRVYDAIEYDNLLEREEFNPPLSSESHRRREFYKNQKNREQALSTFSGEYFSFLRTCEIELTISLPSEENIDRIHELVQRTNQLNFSGNRYSRENLHAILTNSQFDAYSVDCKDKYGDYGTVGFGIIDRDKQQLIDLMFSCRVQSKRVEHAFLSFLLKRYKREGGWEKFYALYNQTERNSKAGAVFDDMGFAEVGKNDGHKNYQFDLNKVIPDDSIITIFWSDKECSV